MLWELLLLQVLTGSALGWLAAQTFPEPPTKAKEYYGWHPNKPAKSASAIAGTTALATGVPHAASALMPAPSNPPEGGLNQTDPPSLCPAPPPPHPRALPAPSLHPFQIGLSQQEAWILNAI